LVSSWWITGYLEQNSFFGVDQRPSGPWSLCENKRTYALRAIYFVIAYGGQKHLLKYTKILLSVPTFKRYWYISYPKRIRQLPIGQFSTTSIRLKQKNLPSYNNYGVVVVEKKKTGIAGLWSLKKKKTFPLYKLQMDHNQNLDWVTNQFTKYPQASQNQHIKYLRWLKIYRQKGIRTETPKVAKKLKLLVKHIKDQTFMR
jgi:hypothetical protein